MGTTRIYGTATILAVLIGMLGAACNTYYDPARDDISKYMAFYEAVRYERENGSNKTSILYRIDSFYSTKQQVPPAAAFYKHEIKYANQVNAGDNDAANRSVDSMLAMVKKYRWDKHRTKQYITALKCRGSAMFNLGRLDEAYNSYFTLRMLAQEYGDSSLMHAADYEMAMTLYQQKNYAMAKQYFMSSYQHNVATGYDLHRHMQEILGNIGLCYERLGQPDSALVFYNAALDYIGLHAGEMMGEITAQRARAVVYGNMGGVYLRQGETEKALGFLLHSYNLNIQPLFDNADALLTHIKIARSYLAMSNLVGAFDALERIGREMDTIPHTIEPVCHMHQMLAEYYTLKNNYPKALWHTNRYIAARDSAWGMEKRHLQQNVTSGLKNLESVHNIDLLTQKAIQNKYLLGAAMGVLALVLIIVIQVYNNNKKGRRHIAQLTELNKQVELQKTELVQKNQEKDRIMNVVAHDLRSPVSGIAMLSEIMMREPMPGEEVQAAMTSIHKAAAGTLQLINELLEHRNNTPAELQKEETDLAGLAREIILILQPAAGRKQQQLLLSGTEKPTLLRLDKGKMRRVFTNLITNAIKFSPEGKTIEVRIEQIPRHVLVTVRDEGIGIPAIHQPHVFDMFAGTRRPGTMGEKSHGLGLSITRQIVEAHGGRIWLESEEGKGTRFFVELPR